MFPFSSLIIFLIGEEVDEDDLQRTEFFEISEKLRFSAENLGSRLIFEYFVRYFFAASSSLSSIFLKRIKARIFVPALTANLVLSFHAVGFVPRHSSAFLPDSGI